MGGIGSGGHRWGEFRPTAEACYRVDAKMLRKLFTIPLGETARVGSQYSSNHGDKCAILFDYTGGANTFTLHTKRLGKEFSTQRIRLSFTPCRYGGCRVWFHCPHCGRRAFRLYCYLYLVDQNWLPKTFFSCRRCSCVRYECQLANDEFHKLKARAGKIKKRLGGDDSYMASLPDKPRWMRWATYSRLAKKLVALEERADRIYMLSVARKMPDLFKGFHD